MKTSLRSIPIKRIYLSLIEVSIAFGLMMAIASLLFFSFRTVSIFSKKISQVKPKIIERHICYQRLASLFSHIDPTSLFFAEEDPPTLCCTFENPIDPTLSYGGRVQAKIFLSKKHELLLDITPHDPQKSNRREVLLENVEAIVWSKALPTALSLWITPSGEEPYALALFLPKGPDDVLHLEGDL